MKEGHTEKTTQTESEVLSAPGETRREPLRESVRLAVECYFEHLGSHDTCGLYNMVLGEVEAPLLEAVMRHTNGNQSHAATVLGINRGTLRTKLKRYGLNGTSER